jgi:hypothetical protein
MNDLDDILVQLDRTRFQPKSDRWITLPELRSESEFPDPDMAPDQSHSHASVSNLRFSTITKQVRKKKLSKKSTKERIADKSIGLAERVGFPAPK